VRKLIIAKSFLNLLLLSASTVIIFVVPKKVSKNIAGVMRYDSTGGSADAIKTCKAPVGGEFNQCDFTATEAFNSFTTEGPGTSADYAITTGILNTGLIYSSSGILRSA
jgi:hypothetical protein